MWWTNERQKWCLRHVQSWYLMHMRDHSKLRRAVDHMIASDHACRAHGDAYRGKLFMSWVVLGAQIGMELVCKARARYLTCGVAMYELVSQNTWLVTCSCHSTEAVCTVAWPALQWSCILQRELSLLKNYPKSLGLRRQEDRGTGEVFSWSSG